MQIRKFLAGLLVFLPFMKSFSAEQKNKVSMGVNYYEDNGGVKVYSPTFEFLKKLTNKFFFGIKARIDAITSASIRNGGRPFQPDAVTGASPRGWFDDVRYATSLFGIYDDGEKSITLGGYISTENDYDGRSIFVNLIKQFNENNTILGINISQSFDNWRPIFRRKLPKTYRRERKTDLSFTQLLTPTSMVQFVYTNVYSEGFLSSPYYYVILDDIARFERYPDTRTGHAFTVKFVKLITERMSANVSYRYYLDSWNINSHTVNTKIFMDITEKLIIGVRYRFYKQTKAYFTKPINQYTLNDEFYVIDYKMSSFSSNTFGFSFIYKPKGKFLFNLENIKFEGSIDYYFTSTNEYIKSWYGVDRLEALFSSFLIKYQF